MALIEKLYAAIQAILPQRLLSRLVHALMRIRLAPVKNAQIAIVGGLAGVDWSESKHQSAADFETFAGPPPRRIDGKCNSDRAERSTAAPRERRPADTPTK